MVSIQWLDVRSICIACSITIWPWLHYVPLGRLFEVMSNDCFKLVIICPVVYVVT